MKIILAVIRDNDEASADARLAIVMHATRAWQAREVQFILNAVNFHKV